MDAKQDLELTIRTATAIKSLSHLIGVGTPQLAKMMYSEAVQQIIALGEFIDKCNAQGKEVKP